MDMSYEEKGTSTNDYYWKDEPMAREEEAHQGTPGSGTSADGCRYIMLRLQDAHKIAKSGGPWSPKSRMDMEPVID